MRQRVMIAIAMANDPDLLIADEPTTALDVTIQAQVMEVLARIRARTGAAMVLITHDLGLVAESADRVAVMYGGRMMERAGVGATFAEPRHPYTVGLIASLPRLDRSVATLYSIPGQVPNLAKRPPGCVFHPRCGLSNGRAACREQIPAFREIGAGSPGCLPLRRRDRAVGACDRDRSIGRGRCRPERPIGRSGVPRARGRSGSERISTSAATRAGVATRLSAVRDVSFVADRADGRWDWSANPAAASPRWAG